MAERDTFTRIEELLNGSENYIRRSIAGGESQPAALGVIEAIKLLTDAVRELQEG